jgi:hypothetical protein
MRAPFALQDPENVTPLPLYELACAPIAGRFPRPSVVELRDEEGIILRRRHPLSTVFTQKLDEPS